MKYIEAVFPFLPQHCAYKRSQTGAVELRGKNDKQCNRMRSASSQGNIGTLTFDIDTLNIRHFIRI
jgi:hypothetical protein